MNTKLRQIAQNDSKQGVGPKPVSTLNPRQQRFMELYLDVDSSTFGNCYQSAIRSGFSDQTARNLTHNRPKWYSETIGLSQGVQPEHLLLKLTAIVNDAAESTQNKLKAVDMLMKHYGMYKSSVSNFHLNQINIQSVLD